MTIYRIKLSEQEKEILAKNGITEFLINNQSIRSQLYVLYRVYDGSKGLKDASSEMLSKFSLFTLDPIHPPEGIPTDIETRKAFLKMNQLIEKASETSGLVKSEIIVLIFLETLEHIINLDKTEFK